MLAENITEASQLRIDLARRIADQCPPELADEIGVSGSAARGRSDDESDLEINIWVKTLPDLDARTDWLASLNIENLTFEEHPRDDESHWASGIYAGIEIEIGWQTYDALDAVCDKLLSGTVTDRNVTFLADLLLHVILLRDTGEIEQRRARLRRYPERMQRESLKAATARIKPDYFSERRRLARNGETLALNERLIGDLDAAIQIIYAAHKRWMPGRKWTMTEARTFAPKAWLDRFDSAMTEPDPFKRIDAVVAVLKGALAEVPCDIDVYGTLAVLDS